MFLSFNSEALSHLQSNAEEWKCKYGNVLEWRHLPKTGYDLASVDEQNVVSEIIYIYIQEMENGINFIKWFFGFWVALSSLLLASFSWINSFICAPSNNVNIFVCSVNRMSQTGAHSIEQHLFIWWCLRKLFILCEVFN